MVVIDKTFTVEITYKEAEAITQVLAKVARDKRKEMETKRGGVSAQEYNKMADELSEIRRVRDNFAFLCGTTFYGE